MSDFAGISKKISKVSRPIVKFAASTGASSVVSTFSAITVTTATNPLLGVVNLVGSMALGSLAATKVHDHVDEEFDKIDDILDAIQRTPKKTKES